MVRHPIQNIGEPFYTSNNDSEDIYVITFVKNDYNNQYLYSTKCIVPQESSFNILYHPSLLSGYIVVSNNEIVSKHYLDEDISKNNNLHIVHKWV